MNIPNFQLTPRVLPRVAAAHPTSVVRKHNAHTAPAATVEISPEARRAAAHPTPAPGRSPDNVIWGNSPKK